jgi:hypothetical protein
MSEADLTALQSRNARVEADKAWEISKTRRGIIAAVTYITAFIYMQIVGLPYALFGAFVPAGGYVLSTMGLPYIKKYWLQHSYLKKDKA